MEWVQTVQCLCVIFLSTTTAAANVGGKKNESQLIKDVLEYYDPLVGPNRNNSPDWSVKIGLHINSLVDMNEKEQVLSLSASFVHFWEEPLLRWDAEDYESEVLYLPPEMLWKPDIVIQNAVENFGQIGNKNLKIYVSNNGSVMWFPGDFYKLYCKVDVRHYPFDTQKCKIILVPWSCIHKIINLEVVDADMMNYETSEENGEWKLVSLTSKRVWTESSRNYRVHFHLELQRKTLFYTINMIMPIVFLSLLNSLTFLLPASSGEKMTLCISVLLSYAVFLTLVNDALPENSDGVCFFSAYLATEIFLSAAATIVSVLILTYHYKVSGMVKAGRLMTWILPPTNNKVQDEVWATKIMGINPEGASETDGDARYVNGTDAARCLDKLFFKVFTLGNLLVTVIFFCAMCGAY